MTPPDQSIMYNSSLPKCSHNTLYTCIKSFLFSQSYNGEFRYNISQPHNRGLLYIYQALRTKILSSLNFLALSKVTFISLSLSLYVCVCVCVCPQSCPTVCNPMDYSLPGSSVHGISQARILECVAISSSRGSS